MSNEESFTQQVLNAVCEIPRGRVATYGQIAKMLGRPRSARYVGFALRRNPEPVRVPCHRVVFKGGSICTGYAFGGPQVQRALLEDEGVVFRDETHVDMDACSWCPDDT